MKLNFHEAKTVLKEIFKNVSVISDIQIKDNVDSGFYTDIHYSSGFVERTRVIVMERAVPQSVANTIKKTDDDPYYRILMAPYISNTSANLCESSKIGYCDYSGNCLISMDSVYLSNKGNPNKYPYTEQAKTIFNPSAHTTSLILRELLKDVSKNWKLKTLSKSVGCSIGMVSRIKTYLCEQCWAEMDKNGLQITEPEKLMKEWSSIYQIHNLLNCYTLDPIPVFESKCYSASIKTGASYCLTGYSGGVRYAPVVRYTKAHLWLEAQYLDEFLPLTNCKEVDSGSNVVIYLADSSEYFWDKRMINGQIIASPVQIYLDCMQLKGRGEEIAEAVFYKEILK